MSIFKRIRSRINRFIVGRARKAGQGDRERHNVECFGALANCKECRLVTAQVVASERLRLGVLYPWLRPLIDESFSAYLHEAFKGPEGGYCDCGAAFVPLRGDGGLAAHLRPDGTPCSNTDGYHAFPREKTDSNACPHRHCPPERCRFLRVK